MTEIEKAKDELAKALAALEFTCIREGGHMPSLATLLRLCADEMADRYPDDTNGGGQYD